MSDALLFAVIMLTLGGALTLAVYAALFITRVLVSGTEALARWMRRTW